MSKGYVYVLSNPVMPNVVKIGRTTRDVDQRAIELFQTGVPVPFKVEGSVCSPDCETLEAFVHHELREKRISDSREFFACCAHEALFCIENALREQVEDWLEDFIPDQTIVDSDGFVDVSAIGAEAHNVGIPWPDIAQVLMMMTEAELRPAYERLKRWREADKQKNEASNEPQGDQLGV